MNKQSNQTKKLKLGIVGLGRAATLMLPTILNHPHFEITAAATRTKEVRERFEKDFNAEVYATIEELCQSPSVDVVYIATPHEHHCEQVIVAAEAGKHILVEKPIALSLEECDKMIEAVERNGVKMVVGPTHSFNSPVLKIAEMAKSGELGSIKMIHAFNYTDFLYRPRRPEELDTSKGGGIIFNQLPHQVSIVRLLGGGMVKSVRGSAGIWDPSRPTEGSATAFLEFENDVSATILYSGYGHFDSDEFHSWVGESGGIKEPSRYGQARSKLQHAKDAAEETQMKKATGYGGFQREQGNATYYHPHFGIVIASFEKGDVRITPEGVMVYRDDRKEHIPLPMDDISFNNTNVLTELYESIVLDRSPTQDGRWGRANLEVCLAILESGRHKREVYLSRQVPL